MSKLISSKMRCILFIIIYLISGLNANRSVNYCGSKMCSHTNAHTFCQYPAGPSPACTGHMEARLSTDEKMRVMVRLNRRRRETALGLGSRPTAGDMLKLRWVEELAREAQRWANQCRPPSTPEEHDVCRDLYSITVGQCVASVVGEAPGLRPETMVDIWYMQSTHYKGNISVYITPEEEDNNYYGDFGQIMWSQTFMVGCGRSRFMTEWRGRVRSVERLVCNFAPRGPIARQPLWRPAEPATACPTRALPDADLPGLCTYHYDMEQTSTENNSMTLEDQFLLETVLDIERNKSLDYIGSLDEIYLTRLAVANIENFDSTSSYNSVQKRDLTDTSSTNDSSTVKIELNVATVNINRLSINTIKKNAGLVGRPKSYKVEDLNDPNDQDNINYYKKQATTSTDKDVYGYDEYSDIEDTKSTTLSTTKVIEYSDIETTTKNYESMDSNEIDITTAILSLSSDTQEILFSLSSETQELIISSSSDTQEFISRGDSTVSQASYVLNESSIEDNVIDDYLTDPETALQLQKALERSERKIAVSPAGKVRRELRRQNSDIYKTRPDLSAELERNKTIDRGPMLSMVLKYMPYLKSYEKSILGHSSSAIATTISPFIIIVYILLLGYF